MFDEPVVVGTPDPATTNTQTPQEVTVVPAQAPDDGRPRDAQGRFLPQTPEGQQVQQQQPPQTPSPLAKFSQPLLDAARSVMLTDDQIASISDPSLLFDVVRGRSASMQRPQTAAAPMGMQPPAMMQTVAQTPVPVAEPPLPDFNLTLPEGELDPGLIKTLKDLATYANTLKATLAKKLEVIEGKNKSIEQSLQATAQSAQAAAQGEQARFWDDVASSVPGMVQAIGRPSIAARSPQSAQSNSWAEIAPLIIARGQAQNVPPEYIDYQRAAAEAWDLYQHLGRNKNGSNGNGPNLPGQTVHGVSRQPGAPAPDRELSPKEEYARMLAAVNEMFAANGNRNPFDSLMV